MALKKSVAICVALVEQPFDIPTFITWGQTRRIQPITMCRWCRQISSEFGSLAIFSIGHAVIRFRGAQIWPKPDMKQNPTVASTDDIYRWSMRRMKAASGSRTGRQWHQEDAAPLIMTDHVLLWYRVRSVMVSRGQLLALHGLERLGVAGVLRQLCWEESQDGWSSCAQGCGESFSIGSWWKWMKSTAFAMILIEHSLNMLINMLKHA